MSRTRLSRAFTLTEILVVIVVMLIGVLVMIRLYPRGFLALQVTRDYGTAQSMGRGELDILESRAEDLPHQILAVRYRFVPDGFASFILVLEADPDTLPTDLGPGGDLLESGNILITNPGGADAEIFWRLYNDANRIRRIIGEGGTIPAPRAVGADFGGLRILNFAPVLNVPGFPTLFLIYSNDMEGRRVTDTTLGDPRRNPRSWQFSYDNEAEQLWLPGVAGRVSVIYKVNFSYWVNDALGFRKVDLIDVPLTVVTGGGATPPREANYDATGNEVEPFDLRAIASDANWVELVADSITANRLFEPIPIASAFDPNYPYEYKLLSPQLGMVLFNPAAYNARERRRRGTRPLVAQVNYDVYNWHVLREEFRADLTKPPLHKLRLGHLKSVGSMQNDKRRYTGLRLDIPDGLGGVVPERDFVLIDMATGGVVSPFVDPSSPGAGRSYKVDYLRGVVALGGPLSPVPGSSGDLAQSITIIAPGDPAVPILMTGINPRGRNFRALFEAHNDWAVQIMKAPSRYSIIRIPNLSIAQCYIPVAGISGIGTRIYFPWADLEMKVSVREIWYENMAGEILAMRDQDFLIRAPLALDPVGKPYIDIKDVDANARTMEESRLGYPARGVSGSSIKARVIWNSLQKEDVPGDTPQAIAERRDLHDQWTRAWRSVVIESYLSRRDTN
ncbi:MAG: type II secretion system protein [Armatimonadetes bacterium]|nr:type II secretion system protein [Armatimonadota bacterium]